MAIVHGHARHYLTPEISNPEVILKLLPTYGRYFAVGDYNYVITEISTFLFSVGIRI